MKRAEIVAGLLFLSGLLCIVAACFMLAAWLGLLSTGVALIALARLGSWGTGKRVV